MSVLEISNITKKFGDLTAVNDVSFSIDDGEFVSVLGPSGSGKSTILRMIAGFEDPTSGEVLIEDQVMTNAPPFDRDINMVFQDLALFPHLTVGENVGYGLKQKGVKKSERVDRIEEMLEVVELTGYENRDIDQLSGGEQQRVALARALVNEPKIVLFDEPLASLDRKLRQHMQFELQRIQSETGITFLYVTHDQEVAMSVSDRMLVLNDGTMEQFAPVESIYDMPASKFVAEFIGNINLIPGTVADTNGTTASVDVGDHTIEITDVQKNSANGIQMNTNDGVDIGVRPSKSSLSSELASNTALSVPGRIENRAYSGDVTIYTVETEYGSFRVSTEDSSYRRNDKVSVNFNLDDIYLFAGDQQDQAEASV